MTGQSAAKRPSAPSDAAVSNMAGLTVASRKRPNFPLPRDLRDHIYQYLLHSDYTRAERKWVHTLADESDGNFERQGYKFQTNILAVNRAMPCVRVSWNSRK